MLIYRKNPESILEACREAPRVGTPFIVDDSNKANKFYVNDPKMNQIIGGYSKGPDDSYAKELMKKYPLRNE